MLDRYYITVYIIKEVNSYSCHHTHAHAHFIKVTNIIMVTLFEKSQVLFLRETLISNRRLLFGRDAQLTLIPPQVFLFVTLYVRRLFVKV